MLATTRQPHRLPLRLDQLAHVTFFKKRVTNVKRAARRGILPARDGPTSPSQGVMPPAGKPARVIGRYSAEEAVRWTSTAS